MIVLSFLTVARAIIADPKRWTQREAARDARGLGVFAFSGQARCWCAYGALDVAGARPDGPVGDLLRAAAAEVHHTTVVKVNDELGHPAVLAMYDRAIALASAEEVR